jgi:cyanate lyase
MTRNDVTALVVFKRTRSKRSWAELADLIGQSKEGTTSALPGKQKRSKAEAETLEITLYLPEDAVTLLERAPCKCSSPETVPTDALIHHFYEVDSMYGTTLNELIVEEFGDRIMKAIDFTFDLQRESNDAGDRVNVTLSGKVLAYKKVLNTARPCCRT